MTISRGTIFERTQATPTPPVGGATIIGIIGDGQTGNVNTPISVSSVSDADAEFGSGSILDAVTAIQAQGPARVVGVRMDDVTDKVVSASVTTGGSGYTSSPTVAFTGGGGGTGAAATATITSGAVTSVNITNRGSGYTTAPTISFTGGGGSGAAATAKIGTREDAAIDAMDTWRLSESVLGLRLNVLCGNGETITRTGTGANVQPANTSSPAFSKLGAMASELKCVAFADASWTNREAAMAWQGNNTHANIVSTFPRLNMAGVDDEVWGSAFMAGVTVREDRGIDRIAHSPDNKIIEGGTHGNVVIPYSEEASSDLHQLDSVNLLTFVYQNGMRSFGGLTAGTGVYSAMPVLRIAYKIENETKQIADAYRGRRNLGGLTNTINGSFQDYLDAQVADGLIISGTSTPDGTYNALQANVENGRLRFLLDVQVVIATRLITLRLNQFA